MSKDDSEKEMSSPIEELENLIENSGEIQKVLILIPKINEFIDKFDEILDPMFQTAEKLRLLVEKYKFTAETFKKFQGIVPKIKKIFKDEKIDFSI
jgi:hypothetical protein